MTTVVMRPLRQESHESLVILGPLQKTVLTKLKGAKVLRDS